MFSPDFYFATADKLVAFRKQDMPNFFGKKGVIYTHDGNKIFAHSNALWNRFPKKVESDRLLHSKKLVYYTNERKET